MRITFIRLNMFEHISSDAMKPLLFGIIKSLTPTEHTICFLDERAEKLPEKIDSDIIALSVETYTAKRAYILAKKYKTDNNIIVMGGFHACVMPEEILHYADSVLIGDAEDTWGDFLTDCVLGRPKSRYVSAENHPLMAVPDVPGVYRHKYHGIGVYQLSRGCKYNCGFCSIKTMYHCVRRKSLDIIYEELRAAKEKVIFFVDDNLFYDKTSAMEFFEKIAPLKKKWACQISMDAAGDDGIIKAMKRAGCFLVLIGFESINAGSLAEMNKKANVSADYAEIIRRIRKHRLLVYGTFVLGCDSDTTDVFEKTFEFAVKNRIAITNFNPLIPMPGTSLYKKMEAEGRLLYKKWWLSDSYRYGETAFMPKHMTPEQLRDGCLKMRMDFYSAKSVIRRLFSSPVNFLPLNFFVFILANVISHREILQKQGQMLGGYLYEADAD